MRANAPPVSKQKAQPSVTFTAILWLGMIIALCGLVLTVAGFGHAVDFRAKFGDFELQTTSAGLALLALGLGLDGLVATRLPAGVSVFEVRKPTPLEQISRYALWLCGAALLAAIACALSVAR